MNKLIVSSVKLLEPLLKPKRTITHQSITKLSNSLTGRLRVVFLSDIHFHPDRLSFEEFDSIINHISRTKPDLIVLGGDYVGVGRKSVTAEYIDEVLCSLNKLTEVAPVFAVLGNHEHMTGDDWIGLFNEKTSITLLENDNTSLMTDKGVVAIRGLSNYSTGHYTFTPFTNTADLLLTVTHDPYAIEIDAEKGLMLAGHTHAGQINPGFISPLFWIGSDISKQFLYGYGCDSGKHWYVSSGCGVSSANVRLGTKSEWVVIDIDPFSQE